MGVTKTQFSIIGGAVMVGSTAPAIPFGIPADRWNKFWFFTDSDAYK